MGAGGHHIAYLKRQVAEVGATVPSRVHRGGRLQPLQSRRIRELSFAYDVLARRVIFVLHFERAPGSTSFDPGARLLAPLFSIPYCRASRGIGPRPSTPGS
jgi:hypothetical protein